MIYTDAVNFKIPNGSGGFNSYPIQDIKNKRTRKNITNNLANLPAAIAEQNLQKYGYDIGDYFEAGGYTYTLADLNTFYGGYSSYGVVNIKHITIVVDANTNVQWNTSNTTATGYVGSNLHAYLVDTVLPNVKSHIQSLFGDSWENHLIKHSKLYRNGEGKWAWGWSNDQYISALTSVQLHGSPICDMDGTDTGEGNKPLEVFQKFFYPEILGNQNNWLRSVSAAGSPCRAHYTGDACGFDGASYSHGAVGLIIFK